MSIISTVAGRVRMSETDVQIVVNEYEQVKKEQANNRRKARAKAPAKGKAKGKK